MYKLLDKLEEKILLLDGAMGTELQKRRLKPGDCPEKLNLTRPDVIYQVHKSYVDAGSDIIQANTFGANRFKLSEYDLQDRIADIIKEGVALARSAATGSNVLISGSIGSTGKLLEPMGDLSFQSAYEVFKEQAQLLEEAGVDLINIETMTDIQEARAALIAVKENTSVPVICNLTFDKGGKTISGTDPLTAVTVLEGLKVDVIGINCSLGPEGMIEILKEISKETTMPLCYQPNAGLPVLNDKGETEFPLVSDKMAGYVLEAVKAGANIIGGCCGTGPEYIKQAARILKEEDIVLESNAFTDSSSSSKKDRTVYPTVKLASRTKTVKISQDYPTRVIGEKINPSGKEELKEEMKRGEMNLTTKLAKRQVKAGADVLDINVGVAGVDQSELMSKSLRVIHNSVDVPVSIDTDNIKVMELALKSVVGRPLLNSVTGEEERLNKILPLAVRYGAAVVGLTLDSSGIPKTVDKRYNIAEKIVDKCLEIGLTREDIIIDPLVLTAGTSQEQLKVTLDTLRMIKDRLKVNTILGISNISYGLPERNTINQSFLPMALQAGLTVPIMDPTDQKLMQLLRAGDVLTGRDSEAKKYIKAVNNSQLFDDKEKEKFYTRETEETVNQSNIINKVKQDRKQDKIGLADSNGDKSTIKNDADLSREEEVMEQIKYQVLTGSRNIIVEKINLALQEYEPVELINTALIPAIKEVGNRYEKGEYYLPQLMASANTVQEALEIIKPHLQKENREIKGRILLATVKGDLHDIGKNLVKIMLENNGFKVFDLGKNVADQEIIKQAVKLNVDIIALSSLMTTTMSALKRITEKIKKNNPQIKVLIGGAVVSDDYAEMIGADGYARDAFGAIREAERIIKEKTK